MCRGHFLTACIGLLLSWHYHGLSAIEPGFLDFDNLPETNFSCEGKVIGGYYADTETGCQMFHVCTIGQKGEITDIKFLCLNGTVFDQETRVCERLDEVDCSKSESFYDLNLELYGNHGAGYGIQPENESELCEEEDDDCKTEKPSAPAKSSPTEQAQSPSDESEEEEEETTTQQPLTSTTSRRPLVTSTSFPSTTPSPQILQFPSSSPETIAALLALHKAFTQSLQQHSKDKVNPPKLTGFVESLNPLKSTQEAETFEIKGPTLSSRLPTPFSTKTQTQFNIPENPLKTQFQSPPKPQYQSPPKPQFQSPPKPQYQSQQKPQFQISPKPQFQSPPKPQFQSLPKPQYQSPPKTHFQSQPKPLPPPPPPLPPVFSKPVQTTSESYGNVPFRHSFHISSQVSNFPDPNYQEYLDHDTQASSEPQTEAPKQYDFIDYEDDYYDEKPHSSTITPYLLHQLKVNQVQSANQAKVSSVQGHGSFVREVSNPSSSKSFNVPSSKSVTTPGIAIITATSTTSSSSVKTSKPLQGAIQPHKDTVTAEGFVGSRLHNLTQQLPDPPQSYDDYKEGDVRSDPFYKDVPKIGRNKRSIDNNLVSDKSVSVVDYATLTNLKDNLINRLFKNNSETVLDAILNQYCRNQGKSNDSLVSYCLSEYHSKHFSDTDLNDKWRIVVPQGDSEYLYIVKTILNSNPYQTSISNILLLVHFPDEIKSIRDVILKKLKNLNHSNGFIEDIDINNVNSSIHHRFKRVRRNKPKFNLKKHTEKVKRLKNKQISRIKQKMLRKKRQIPITGIDENFESGVSVQPTRGSRKRGQRARFNSENQQTQIVVRRRPVQTVDSLDEPRATQSRTRQRTPVNRRQQLSVQSTLATPTEQDVKKSVRVPSSFLVSSRAPSEDSRSSSHQLSTQDKNLGERPTSRRRGQGVKYHFSENPQPEQVQQHKAIDGVPSDGDTVESSTTYPFNLQPGTQFSCEDKIKGGYYADVEAECYGYFICSQGEINGPLLKSHFWCGPTTKFNQRSRTCQTEANVACAVSERYFYLNKDILSLPDPDDDVKDSFEPSKVHL